jgi:hypothetical protein
MLLFPGGLSSIGHSGRTPYSSVTFEITEAISVQLELNRLGIAFGTRREPGTVRSLFPQT